MTSNIDRVMASFDAWRREDAAALAATYASDVRVHEHATGRTLSGAHEVAAHHLAWRRVFPDIDGEMGTVLAEGRMVALQLVWRGTHRGDLPLPDGTVVPATGRPIAVPAAWFFVLVDGLIVEMQHYFDAMTMLAQLGAAPAGDTGVSASTSV